MGVAGSGKTTIGRLLAARLGWEFLDADDFHSPENVAKMRAGNPLDDADRAGWLERLRTMLDARARAGRATVLACSALRENYRNELRRASGPVEFVYLRGDYALLHRRMLARPGHYMPPELLASQFATLEAPANALTVSVELPPDEIVAAIVTGLKLAPQNAH